MSIDIEETLRKIEKQKATSDNKWTDFWFKRLHNPKAIEEAHAKYIR